MYSFFFGETLPADQSVFAPTIETTVVLWVIRTVLHAILTLIKRATELFSLILLLPLQLLVILM